MTRSFHERIAGAAFEKKSRTVLAIDPPLSTEDPLEFAEIMVKVAQRHICAIKINLHLLLPLAGSQIARINRLAHSFGLQSIADIKLNDIESTNDAAIHNLVNMGFDAAIANPFVGSAALASLVRRAHSLEAGIIALVYMSHPGATEGFGLEIIAGRKRRRLYTIFLERASLAKVDGIVVGATRLEILKQVMTRAKPLVPVYSPGIGTQGGQVEKAIRGGASYLIIGRSIIEARDPARAAEDIKSKTMSLLQP